MCQEWGRKTLQAVPALQQSNVHCCCMRCMCRHVVHGALTSWPLSGVILSRVALSVRVLLFGTRRSLFPVAYFPLRPTVDHFVERSEVDVLVRSFIEAPVHVVYFPVHYCSAS